MKIAFLPDYYLPHVGGMQVWTREMGARLALRGHEVTVLSYRVSGEVSSGSDSPNVERRGWPPVNRPHAYSSLMLSRLSGLPGLLLREGFDVCLPTVTPLLVASALGVEPLVPVWHGLHDLEFGITTKGLVRGSLRTMVQAAAVRRDVPSAVAVSECVRRALISSNPQLRERVTVIRGGVDTKAMSALVAGDRQMRIVFMGRLVPGKGVWDTVRAFLRVRRGFPGLELLIVGEGPLRPRLERFVTSLHDRDRGSIRLAGQVSGQTRFRVLSEAKALLCPSRYEAAPLAPVESLSWGTPFLAYDIPALQEIRDLAGGGVLVPTGSVSALAKGLESILGSYERFSKEAHDSRRRVREVYSWDRGAERLERVLLRVVTST